MLFLFFGVDGDHFRAKLDYMSNSQPASGSVDIVDQSLVAQEPASSSTPHRIQRILIDFEDFGNMGFVDIITGFVQCMRNQFPNVEIVVFSNDPGRYKRFENIGITIRQNPWRWMGKHRRIKDLVQYIFWTVSDLSFSWIRWLTRGLLFGNKWELDRYDLVVHWVIDWTNEADTSFLRCVPAWFLLFVLTAICNRPIALMPSTLGPFKNPLSRKLARFIFDRVDIVALRESASFSYVGQLALKKAKVALNSDLAFLLEPVSREKGAQILDNTDITLDHNRPYFGICPNLRNGSKMRYDSLSDHQGRRDGYVQFMADLVNYLAENMNARICLIPHVYDYDDQEICVQICKRTLSRYGASWLGGQYSPQELKGIIGSFDLFIGSWMHSTIAALSMGVPTLAMAFSDKFFRLVGGTMGQSEYIIDVRNRDASEVLEETKRKLHHLWTEREAIRIELKERTAKAQAMAWSYGELIRDAIA